jgi:hypothetical protein
MTDSYFHQRLFDMKFFRFSFLIFCAALIFIPFTTVYSSEKVSSLSSYYHNLFSGEYRSAIDTCCQQFDSAADESQAAAAMFRIEESVVYAESAPYAEESLLRLFINGKGFLTKPEVREIAESLLISLSVRASDYSSADDLRNRAGRRKKLLLHGPFPVNGESDFKEIIAASHSPGFTVIPDQEGIYRIDSLFENVKNRAFIAEEYLSISEDAEIRLSAGSSGNIDIYVDDQLILSDREPKKFFPVQKTFLLDLSKGKHKILYVVAGNDANEASFCVSVIGADETSAGICGGKVLSCTPAPSLFHDTTDPFLKGYLLYKSGYVSQESAGNAFDSIQGKESFEWALSRYYRALASEKDEITDSLLQAAAHGGVTGAYGKLSRLALLQGRIIQGSSYLDLYEKENPHSPELLGYKAERALASLWFEEALDWCESLRRSGYSSAADDISATVYSREGYPREEYLSLIKAYSLQKNNQQLTARLCSSGATSPDISILDRIVADHPWDLTAAIVRAEKVYALSGPKAALPYISAIIKKVPSNGRILFLAGKCYRDLHNDALSKDYIGRAVTADPEKTEYRDTYDLLFTKQSLSIQDDPEQWGKESEPYKSEPFVCIANDTSISFYDDGSSLSHVREVYRVFVREKAHLLENRSVVINRNTDDLLELRFKSLSHGVTIQGDDIRTQDLSDPENRIYVDLSEYTIKAPDVSPGGYLIFEYTLHSTAARSFRGHFGEERFFDTAFRTLHAAVTVSGSKALHVKSYRCKSSTSVRKDSSGNTITSVSISSIPPVKDEPGMVPFSDRVPSVGVSSFSSWDEFYEWYYSQMKQRAVISSAMKKDIEELCKGSSSTEETVARIYNFTTSRIRYVGDEAGLGGYIPRSAAETYNGRAGDCKDIALLISVLLREKGIDADLALLRTSDAGTADMSFPSLHAFNHAICRVRIPFALYLDGTVKNHGIYDLPSGDRDVIALVIGEKKAFSERIDRSVYSRPLEESETDVIIAGDLSAHIERKLVKKGSIAADDKDDKPENEAALSRYWMHLYPGAAVSNFRKQKDKKTTVTLYSVSIPVFAQKAGVDIFVPVSLLPFNLENSFGKSIKRENDLYIAEERDSISTVTYRFSDDMEIQSIPKNSSFAFKSFSLSYTYSMQNKAKCIVTAKLSFKRDVIFRDDYAKLKEFLSDCALAESSSIIVTKGAAE